MFTYSDSYAELKKNTVAAENQLSGNGRITYINRNGGGNAQIIITTGFWRHKADCAIREYAADNGYALAELNDLGDDETMKAIGLFEHSGVANHPGDEGMKTIADRISEKIKTGISMTEGVYL